MQRGGRRDKEEDVKGKKSNENEGATRRKEQRGGRSDEEEKMERIKNEKVACGRIVDHLGLVFRFLGFQKFAFCQNL